jgi:aminopeptidase N
MVCFMNKKWMFITHILILNLVSLNILSQTEIYDSGGPLMPEQAAYDVRFYDLSLFINPSDSSIDGVVIIKADIVQPVDNFVIDLDTLLRIFEVTEIHLQNEKLIRSYQRKFGKIWIYLEQIRQPGEAIELKIAYGGKPRIAPNPPWNGGFTWEQTTDGSPWIATSCQMEGPDIWWPVKDHVSDEPDSVWIRIRIPDTLVCVSNGRLKSVENHDDTTRTYHWFVSTPINTYNIALNIGPLELIEKDYQSVAGDHFPVQLWVLPEYEEKGKAFFPEIIDQLQFLEQTIGPYPFRADKYGVVQSPLLGMEHQTIIAYGAEFDNSVMTGRDWGFDALHLHEIAHEWWGNMVTNADWKDMWLHEAFAGYMEALYTEHLKGPEAYHAYLDNLRESWDSLIVAPRQSHTIDQIYTGPFYYKGMWVLHSLRYLIGEKAMLSALRRMAYPDPLMEKITDGRQTRFANTDDFINIVEKISGKELDWFFEVYLRQPEEPRLLVDLTDNKLKLHWQAPAGLLFPMPVEIKLGEKTERFEIPSRGLEIKLLNSMKPEIDPHHWILFKQENMPES